MKFIVVILTVFFISNAFSKTNKKLNFAIDSNISKERKQILKKLIEKIESLKFKRYSPDFIRLFGSELDGIISYLNKRVKIIIDDTSEDSMPGINDIAYAINLGAFSWLSAVNEGVCTDYFEFEGKEISIQSPYVGIIQLNREFFDLSFIEQISILLHEAKHSDCQIQSKSPGSITISQTCGFIHDFNGKFAVDRYLDGAHAYEHIFGLSIFKDCINCTSKEKLQGLDIWLNTKDSVEEVKDGPRGWVKVDCKE